MLAVSAGFLLAPAANAAGTVQWDIQKHHPKARFGRRAADTHEGVITNELTRGGYFATCSMGTPGQNLTLQLDTGSSDIWVPWHQATVCEQDKCTLGNCAQQSLDTKLLMIRRQLTLVAQLIPMPPRPTPTPERALLTYLMSTGASPTATTSRTPSRLQAPPFRMSQWVSA